MLLLGDNGALDKFRSKSSVVVGTDFKVHAHARASTAQARASDCCHVADVM